MMHSAKHLTDGQVGDLREGEGGLDPEELQRLFISLL